MGRNRLDAFGPTLRRLRLEKKLTQDQLGEKVDVTSPFISMLESGHNYPNLEMLFRLSDALEVPASAILLEMEERARRRLR